jgi:hypothetical protein
MKNTIKNTIIVAVASMMLVGCAGSTPTPKANSVKPESAKVASNDVNNTKKEGFTAGDVLLLPVYAIFAAPAIVTNVAIGAVAAGVTGVKMAGRGIKAGVESISGSDSNVTADKNTTLALAEANTTIK